MRNINVKNNTDKGLILAGTLVFAFVAIIIITGVTSWFAVVLKSNANLIAKEQAFHIAEAGIEYYRWHLAHDKEDFQDGTGEDGPYIHEVENIEGEVIGSFSLEITPPEIGSTLVTVESTGTVVENEDVSRTIRAELAIPSFAKYAFAADADMRFGEGTTVYGPIHSNGGVRFDGIAYNVVTSAKETYDDPDHSGGFEFGVHTHLSPTDPLPPDDTPRREDVFVAGREFPVAAIDFSGITSDLAGYKALGEDADGIYISSSGANGYLIELDDNDTFDLYRVNSLRSVPHWSCQSSGDSDWGTWSVNNTTYIDTYDFPVNGVVFVEDDLWIEGIINTAKLTIVAAELPDIPSNRKSITVNNDLIYTSYDSSDVIGLIAQQDINVGLYSEDDLQIDAALIAQNGRVGRHYYTPEWNYWFWTLPGCEPYSERSEVTLNGMIASRERYGFAYTDGTGYDIRNINYDADLLYGPPPSFPLTSDYYEPISWEEIE